MKSKQIHVSGWRGLSMATVLGMAGVAAAQKPPDTLSMSPQAPTQANTPALVVAFGDHTILGVQPVVTPLVLPGAMGALQIDPALLLVLPNQYGWGPELNAIAPLLTLPPLQWQVLGEVETGIQFSAMRPLLPELKFTPTESEADCRIRGSKFAQAAAFSELAPNWQGSSGLGEGTPIFRPDVQGPAYYHFDVEGGGHIVLSTGDHDAPVSHWSDEDTSLMQRLELEAAENNASIAQVYRMDMMCWVGEDANGQVVAQIGQWPPKVEAARVGYQLKDWESWDELKSAYATTFRPMLESETMRVAGLWWVERNGQDAPWSPWDVDWAAGATPAQCLYDQFDYNGCAVGCGPVAWAMMFGWADRRAAAGDPNWSHRWGLYRQNGGYGSDATAPRFNSTGADNMIREIKDGLGTFCFNNQGATAPWDMHRAWQYLSGRTWTSLTTNYNGISIHESGLHDMARDEILAGKPAIIGTGFFSHYPVAVGFATRWRDEQVFFWTEHQRQNVFYLNMGWGGSGNGWYDTGTWFCGRIFAN